MGAIFKFTQIPLHQFLTLLPIWYIFENNLFFSSEIIVIGYNKFYACVKFLGIVFLLSKALIKFTSSFSPNFYVLYADTLYVLLEASFMCFDAF